MAFVVPTAGPFRLSNQQWNAIRKAGGLPHAARADIEWALGSVKQELALADHMRPIPKQKLLRVAELADQLLSMVIGKNPKTRAKLRCMFEPDFWSGETAAVEVLDMAGRV
jgi:hypothetical protein